MESLNNINNELYYCFSNLNYNKYINKYTSNK